MATQTHQNMQNINRSERVRLWRRRLADVPGTICGTREPGRKMACPHSASLSAHTNHALASLHLSRLFPTRICHLSYVSCETANKPALMN